MSRAGLERVRVGPGVRVGTLRLLWVPVLVWYLSGTAVAAVAASAVRPPARQLQAVSTTVATTVATPTAQHGPKQGSAAVIVSILGLVVIVVLLVILGSLSARRRARDAPTDEKTGWPSQRRRGFFG